MKWFLLILAIIAFASVAPTGAAQSVNHRVDFRNFTYPGIWLKRPFRLRGGKADAKSSGCMTEYSFQNVQYLDLTGDRKPEALVTIKDWTACGSSGVSEYYYVYSVNANRPRLLWKFATGSESAAGLKEFHINGRTLVIEVYGNYRIVGAKPKVAAWPKICCPDCCPEKYTRLFVSWNGRRFSQTKRAVFPFTFATIDDYEKTRKH